MKKVYPDSEGGVARADLMDDTMIMPNASALQAVPEPWIEAIQRSGVKGLYC